MSYREFVNEMLETDPEFRAEYEARNRESAFRRAAIRARLAAGLTQAELAEQIGTKQPAIARLEGGDRQPTLPMIQKLAAALNVSFEVMPTGDVVVHQCADKDTSQPEEAPATAEQAVTA